jgi:hypothetical protein
MCERRGGPEMHDAKAVASLAPSVEPRRGVTMGDVSGHLSHCREANFFSRPVDPLKT